MGKNNDQTQSPQSGQTTTISNVYAMRWPRTHNDQLPLSQSIPSSPKPFLLSSTVEGVTIAVVVVVAMTVEVVETVVLIIVVMAVY